jgi:uridine kinase
VNRGDPRSPVRLAARKPPREAKELLRELRRFVLPWRALTIGIDGRPGAGKSTLGRYLSWQLGIPLLETDLWISSHKPPFRYKYNQLLRIIRERHKCDRPIIIEGICLLSLMETLTRNCDYLIWVNHQDDECVDDDIGIQPGPLTTEVNSYIRSFRARDNANYLCAWVREEE